MNLRGQRFTLDLSDDSDDNCELNSTPGAFIRDIKERSTTSDVSVPTLKSNVTGFPKHEKRSKVSRFKQKTAEFTETMTASDSIAASPPKNASPPTTTRLMCDETEKRRIGEENQQMIAAMSTEEIESERQELLRRLDPSLIERLLKRANLDENRGDTGIELPTSEEEIKPTTATAYTTEKQLTPVVQERGVPAPQPAGNPIFTRSVRFADDDEPETPIGIQHASAPPLVPNKKLNLHFPKEPAVPDLDPSDPAFLKTLHSKYFADLPIDPSKLAWMTPIPTPGSVQDQESSYYPAQATLQASALRFNFRGGLLPPRISRAVPSSKGLHHHGDAPEAAGYTIPELGHLARSAFPAQRCIAFQTLGRLLYRLGRGEWNGEDSEISKGLWSCVEEAKVILTLEEAAAAVGGHQGSKAYAVEALWLWQKGGGKISKT